MVNRLKVSIVGLCAILLSSGGAAAWGRKGHLVVAQIAEENLTPDAKLKVQQLLQANNSPDLASVANWADLPAVKNIPGHYMHTVRMTLNEEPYDGAIDCPKSNCVVEAIKHAEAVLKDTGSTVTEQMESLKYLVHFVGDIHQPLHAAKNIGRKKVIFNGKTVALHRVWDQSIIADQGLSYRKLAKLLEADDRLSSDGTGSPEQWAVESRDIAIREIYSEIPTYDKNAETVTLPENYASRHWFTIETRLKLAGHRLAAVINGIYEN